MQVNFDSFFLDYNKLGENEKVHRIEYITLNSVFITDEQFMTLITKGFETHSPKFQSSIIKFINSNKERFFNNFFNDLLKHYSYQIPSKRELNDINNLTGNPSGFLTKVVIGNGLFSVSYLLDLLKSEDELIIVFSIRCLNFIFSDLESSVSDKYIEDVINKVINCYLNFVDSLEVKLELARFFSICYDDRAIKLLKYFNDNENDFTLKLISVLSLTSINKRNGCSPSMKVNEIKELLGLH